MLHVRIISDCYGEFQAPSTVKRKTLWNTAANPAWQLVSFVLRDRTQKSCKSSLVLTPSSSSIFISSDPLPPSTTVVFWGGGVCMSFCLCTKKPGVCFGAISILTALYITHKRENPTPQNSLFPPQTSPICSPSLRLFFFYSNSPASERGAWGGTRFLDYFWCAMRIL